MSFSGTPLGQGRRLDRDTFLGKPNSKENRPTSPHRKIPTSYIHGAPVSGSRSPPKPPSPTREHNGDPPTDEENVPALARFARQKQREAQLNSRPGGPKIISSPPNPTKWNVKNTTVNIASAFSQAANSAGEMAPSYNPNNSWASTSRSTSHIPRSTSVEYEQQAQATQGRRLGIPQTRLPGRGITNAQKPPSKSRSLQHVPDSEGEENQANDRGKSPFEQVIDAAKRALLPSASAATYYVRQRSHEPEEPSIEQPSMNGSHAGNDSSYDYEAEERFVQNAMQAERTERRSNHKRSRMSKDNQAWKPSTSDLDKDDSSEDDDDRKQRKGKGKPVGRLTNLPTILDGKTTKKRRPRGSKTNVGAADEEDGAASDDNSYAVSQSQSAAQRTSIPRISVEPHETSYDYSTSLDVTEQGLQSIPEVAEEDLQSSKEAHEKPKSMRTRGGSRATTPSPRSQRFSIGALLGTLVRYVFTLLATIGITLAQFLSSCLFLFGRVMGTIFDVLFNRPYQWIKASKSGVFVSLGRYIVVGFTILSAWYALRSPVIQSYIPRFALPSLPSRPTPIYTPPNIPASNVNELVERLSRIEFALSGLSLDNERTKAKADDGIKSYSELINRLGSIEGRLTAESRRINDAERIAKDTISKGINTVKQEVEVLEAQLLAQQRKYEKDQQRIPVNNDQEARLKLKALEERVDTVEGGVKEAIDLGKKLAATPAPASPAPAGAWWDNILSKSGSKGGLKITSSDGQDVTGLITHLVDSAVSIFAKDGVAKADFALHSGGARVIPSLTSPTFEIKPTSMKSQLASLLTGNGYAIGRPPVTALHHEELNGHCWPFAGTQGQLGVALAMPVYIDEITVDHVAKEVAFDMRTAPRQMEVWAMVEGKDNVEKLKAWREEKIAARRVEAEPKGEQVDAAWEKQLETEMVPYPSTLPKQPEYIRIANFTYDIHSPRNIQTFSADPEIRELGIDFGIVVLRVLNNWGRDEFTCLYRFRVHGRKMGEVIPPYSDSQQEEAS